jgi:superfamily II DNA/RNA helicase
MFALPLIETLLMDQQKQQQQQQGGGEGRYNSGRGRRSGPRALVLNPTRELAMQTAKVFQTYAKAAASSSSGPLRVALTTSGASVGRQKRTVLDPDVVVATPGRILQFVDERVVSLSSVQEVVVDEADRMLDLGFEPQLRRIARAAY